MQLEPSGAKPLAEDQHLFELPPPIERPAPAPMIVKGHVEIRLDFEADIVSLARQFPDEFAAAAHQAGYMPWEQASTFLWDFVNEQVEADLRGIDGLNDTSYRDADIEFTWTPELACELNERLGLQ